MRTLLVAISLFSLAQIDVGAQMGDAQTGKALWEGQPTLCRQCHGMAGEGAFGPDLAGRQLSAKQFTKAVRQPWSIMPAWTEEQLSNQEVADLRAYMMSLPEVDVPGPWRIEVPDNASMGAELVVATIGCGQCHGALMGGPRRDAASVGADYAWFSDLVYNHSASMPEFKTLVGEAPAKTRMGNYSRIRVPEPMLMKVWDYMVGLGLRVPLTARLSVAPPSGDGISYIISLENYGLPGRAPAAADLTITLHLPEGATVTDANNDGYLGVSENQETGVNTVAWEQPRVGPGQTQRLGITLAGTDARPTGTVSWPTENGGRDQVNILQP